MAEISDPVDSDTSRRVDARLDDLYQRHLELDEHEVAQYYRSRASYYGPDEAGDERRLFGICLVGVDGEVYGAGDYEVPLPLHLIAKVVTYGVALDDQPPPVLERVGVKPSGDAFYSLEFDERNNRPYNPMVNAGALVTTEMVEGSSSDEKIERIVEVLRCYTGEKTLAVSEDVFAAELRTADRTGRPRT